MHAPLHKRFTPEFRLMLSLLRESIQLPPVEGAEGLSQLPNFEWERFESTLLAHRVLLPAWRQAKAGGLAMPDAARERLEARYRTLTLRQMRVVSDTLEVGRTFWGAGIRYVNLKGVTLSQRLFGDPLARQCGDIDILVSKDDFARAEAALLEIGFVRKKERYEGRILSGEQRWECWHHSRYNRGLQEVEIHWRFSNHDYFVDPCRIMGFIDRAHFISMAGHRLPLPTDSDLVDHLSLHGAAHCWSRVKWVYDIALLRKLGLLNDQLNCADCDLRRIAQWRELILEGLFGRTRTDHFRFRLGKIVWSARMATMLSRSQLAAEQIDSTQYGDVARRSLALFLVAAGLRRKLRYLARLLAWDGSYCRFRLAPNLAFMYVVIGPLYWLWRKTIVRFNLRERWYKY